ncbi:MAG: Si-specific NAD(P)(+) transhydrogenase [Myxococcales bacterium]|nr:Si-specific NAD(P)(+) transhydrogenase [Myxococcales bacterium]
MQSFDLVCIGSGPAGQRAAVQAAKLGKRVAVIERRSVTGGVCVATGTIPSKTFREAVLHFAAPAIAAGRNLRRDERPSAEVLLARVGELVRLQAAVVEDQLARNDVTLLRGRAAFRDANTVTVETEDGGRELTAKNILIAVGTHPAPPPGGGAESEYVFTSDGILRLCVLPREIAIVGGGVIGIEYASMFACLGVKVTLIDGRRELLEFLDCEIVDELMSQMRARNVTFCLGESVARIDVDEKKASARVSIHTDSGKRIVADMVLFSVGRVGATDDLRLELAGLEVDLRGRLTVDGEFRTRVPHIFAAGDVIGFPSLAATSAEQGRLAACHAFGVAAGPMTKHFPVGIYAIPEISMVGAPEHELTANKVPYEFGMARYREIARGQILGDAGGLLKLLFHREDRRLLGVHAIGTGATELIHIGQAVVALGGTLDYFIQAVFNYPTLAECYKVAALDAFNKFAR